MIYLLFAAVVITYGSYQSMNHLPFTKYVVGHAELFSLLFQIAVVANMLLAGTSFIAFMANSLAAVLFPMVLIAIRRFKGGKRIRWNLSKLRSKTLGFWVETIEPEVNAESFGEELRKGITTLLGGTFRFVKTFIFGRTEKTA
ncbi:hypothetical protein [Thiothrix nivea]|uniref:Uncharacterized protein n=1 Tax=Thiothrix nivea (strain ATCC 35100 / DSM 5205 / JP2) TaxID=870187 RepID=A0A656HJU9_THINJ|nr:hypothetical protein [Thiothrix nivea]EIJ35295.1 hypothetical protein Thini_2758 [Thiothrix nivea DSM 5205]